MVCAALVATTAPEPIVALLDSHKRNALANIAVGCLAHRILFGNIADVAGRAGRDEAVGPLLQAAGWRRERHVRAELAQPAVLSALWCVPACPLRVQDNYFAHERLTTPDKLSMHCTNGIARCLWYTLVQQVLEVWLVGSGEACLHAAFSLFKHCAARLRAGLPADGTIAAEVAFMFNEWYKPDACLEFPRGGSQAIVNALVRCAGPPCTHPCNVPCSLSAKGRHLSLFVRHSTQPCSTNAASHSEECI